MSKINILPIKWFGDREAFMKSEMKIITVGLNPSDKEFHENDGDPFTSQLRFPDYKVGNDKSLVIALNNYFEKNPYKKWFNGGFEPILNGMNASYYSGYLNRTLHTDICSPWATDPTWANLSKSEKSSLMKTGFQDWQQLVSDLSPNIILFSIPKDYIAKLSIDLTQLCKFVTTKNGEKRKRPIIVNKGIYGNSLAVFGRTRNLPFGSLGKEQKKDLGVKILECYHNL